MPDPFLLTTYLRRAFQRPGLRRAAVALVASATAITMVVTFRAAEEAQQGWGPPRSIAVARHDLEAGRPVDVAAVHWADFPSTLIPTSAVADLPVGAVTRYPIAAGEPILEHHLAPTGVSGPAALVPTGHRAVGVPTNQTALPPLRPGDLVDVLAVLPTLPAHSAHGPYDEAPGAHEQMDRAADIAEPVIPLARGARIIDVDDQVITVTVPTDTAPRLAYALTTGIVVLTLTGE